MMKNEEEIEECNTNHVKSWADFPRFKNKFIDELLCRFFGSRSKCKICKRIIYFPAFN